LTGLRAENETLRGQIQGLGQSQQDTAGQNADLQSELTRSVESEALAVHQAEAGQQMIVALQQELRQTESNSVDASRRIEELVAEVETLQKTNLELAE